MMLLLTRRPDQSIRIGDDIVVTVTQIDRGQVKLGIEAPKDVKILRHELMGVAPKPSWRKSR